MTLGRDPLTEAARIAQVALQRIRDHGETHDEPCYALHRGDCADAMQEYARVALVRLDAALGEGRKP